MAYSTIIKPNTNFTTRTYTATGAGSVSDVSFQPDFLWFKNRTVVGNHGLMDSVRGIKKILHSNDATQEATSPANNDFETFTSNGFTYGTSSALDSGSGTPVTWLWKAGGTAVSNTAGSITSSVSANTDSGFSIVSYTGNGGNGTVGHGLGVAPKMVIIKTRSGSGSWVVGHDSMGWGFWMPLDATNAKISSATMFQNTAPTSTVFSENVFGTDTCIAYCFAEKKGFSKFGSYTGNGVDTNGTFVYTGFKPAFIITKNTISGTAQWLMQTADGLNTYNPVKYGQLRPNLNSAEVTAYTTDFLSNGFKFYNDTNQANSTGETFIYMAFAENPLVGSNNIPTTAR